MAVTDTATITGFASGFRSRFESGFGDWSQGAGDEFDWTRRSGRTSSIDTGPSAASEGNYYVYVEATGFASRTALLEGPQFIASSSSALMFDYHMYGSDIGTLELEVSTNNGGSWDSIWELAGDQGDAWRGETIDLSVYDGAVVELRFKATIGANFRSDIALDDIRIIIEPDVTAPVVSINPIAALGPVTITGTASDANPVVRNKLLISNVDTGEFWDGSAWTDDWAWFTPEGTEENWKSTLDLAAGNYRASAWAWDILDNVGSVEEHFTVVADDTPPVVSIDPIGVTSSDPVIISGTASDELGIVRNKLAIYSSGTGQFWDGTDWADDWAWFDPSGTEENWNYSLDLPVGNYQAIAWAWDSSNTRSLATHNFTVRTDGSAPVVPIDPITETPDPDPVLVPGTGFAAGFENGLGVWSQGAGDDLNWTRQSGRTPSTLTGPSAASEGNYYVYVETSAASGFLNRTAILNGPQFLASSVSALTFDYHMYGLNIGTLEVEVSANNGGIWDSIWELSGDQGDVWRQRTIDLSFYDGATIDLRFKVTTGASFRSDIALDNIFISIEPDVTAPVVSIDPIAALGPVTISGTASDANPLVRNRLLVRNVDTGEFWDGSSWTDEWASFTPDGTVENWTATLDLPVGNYRAQAWAWDYFDHLGSDAQHFTVVADEIRPVVTIDPIGATTSAPVNISGTASDNLGIVRNRISIYNSGTGQFWSGTDWTSEWSWFAPNGSESWDYSVDLPTGNYRAIAWAWDPSNNMSNVATHNFTVLADDIAPVVSINPLTKPPIPGPVTISGTASDNTMVDRNKLSIYNSGTGHFWDGSNWSSDWAWFDPNGNESWEYTLDLPAGDYRASLGPGLLQ